MEQFYRQLNGWYREYYQRHPDAALGLQKGMLKNLYAAHYSEMEDCLLKANAQQMTPKQQQRLQLIINNMVVLQWRLRNGGLLPSDYESPLHLSNAAVIALLTKYNKNFPLYPNVVPTERVNWHQPKAFPFKVEFSKVALSAEKKSTFKGMGESQFLLYAAQEGTIRILPQMVTQGVYFAGYKIQNQAGEVLQSGILSDGIPITLPAKKGHAYYLDIALRNTVNYKLEVENAAVAEGNFANKTLTLSGSSAPVYVYCPPSKAPVGITQKGNSVIIRKPFSGMTATAYMRRLGNGYKDIIVLESFDLNWRFSPDPQAYGLKRGVTSPDFDDSSWPTISALNWWQFQGFPDYHGVAWYRKTFTLDKTIPKGRIVYLYFGAIDGNAVIYLNGEKIREHQLGDNYEGWNRQFGTYNGKKIKPGENTIVVKVTSKNDESASGIFKGVSLLTATRIMK